MSFLSRALGMQLLLVLLLGRVWDLPSAALLFKRTGVVRWPMRTASARKGGISSAMSRVVMCAESELTPEEIESLNPTRPKIQWYPGHIAKAERQLTEYMKCVDIVIEVRDARIPFSTTHPLVSTWIGSKPRIVVFNRKDCAPAEAVNDWRRYFVDAANRLEEGTPQTPIFAFNAKSQDGVHEIRKACLRLGAHVNERRESRGLLPRAIRIAVIGFPNVGKSALINRLLGRKMARSADTPGLTRQLTWIRLGKGRDGADIELLDSPGIIPAKQVDQKAAEALAMCNDIGVASYEPEHVASALVERIVEVAAASDGTYVDMEQIVRRCDGFDPFKFVEGGGTSEEFLHKLAERRHRGDLYGAANRLLNDFRKGMFGAATLEVPSWKRQIQKEEVKKRPGSGDDRSDDFDVSKFGVGNFEGW